MIKTNNKIKIEKTTKVISEIENFIKNLVIYKIIKNLIKNKNIKNFDKFNNLGKIKSIEILAKYNKFIR